ncbi:hypothetical protein [Goodfellowiella coeruleoviolacea]|uniref:YggT family protein n=1 Tax=Goodfellowiella coeruleoviolacea TaxID=334858 RepID=A0AAE3GBV4_9PSEU|nr:hypothetical protein [Goodfellowiella coeruleoviolacea]MCP2164550.1 hypothetical protein [Goodfellowiella coeruleoviolacea]
MAARVIRLIGTVFAAFEVLYILLVLFNANPDNPFFVLVRQLAEPLALWFPGLFQLGSQPLDVLVNYGLAAVFWLLVAGLLARVVSRRH